MLVFSVSAVLLLDSITKSILIYNLFLFDFNYSLLLFLLLYFLLLHLMITNPLKLFKFISISFQFLFDFN